MVKVVNIKVDYDTNLVTPPQIGTGALDTEKDACIGPACCHNQQEKYKL